jgi:F-type H+-transporting ATPase subunit epsilon
VTLQVALVVPEGEIWSGTAQRVIAKTLDGDIGVLAGHTPVLGILAEGSLVRILPEDAAAQDKDGGEVVAAVGGGFFSVADDRVSILARQAQLGTDVDRGEARAALDEALQAAPGEGRGEEPADVRYARAVLRASGDES